MNAEEMVVIINRYNTNITRHKGWIYDQWRLVKKWYEEWLQIKNYKKFFAEKCNSIETNSLFETIQIETVNRCNGVCPFCPVNKYVDTRVFCKMTEKLFEKIIFELAEINYAGRVALYCNNEPFLDKRIIEFAQKTREALPKAWIYLYTNGTLVDEVKCRELAQWMDEIVIDNYNDNLVLNDNIIPIAMMCNNDERLNSIIQIHLRKLNEVLYTRGGQSPNNKKRKRRSYPCVLPYSQMVVRPDGKVSLCCSDALGVMTLGDVNIQSLKDIWNSEKYQDIRKMVSKNIKRIPLCEYCDSKHRK